MSNVAISVEGLGKRYSIGAGPAEPYGSLRESMMRALNAPLRRLRRGGQSATATRDVWALKDISFEVKHGEAIGIIGRNGAGKSTLLKLLSRITEPTAGRAVVHGRVGSLLEVGTGFHPELTGRENIYLNGAVMGMSRADIKRRFDEIVEFSGVETYLDTPVKRYSSGMYMRLAFAVAAHLEPEVLVVDEVLAVGDAAFQKRCLGKMGEVAKDGRTVLFVSHNMAAVLQLCKWALWFDAGRQRGIGPTASVVSDYLASDNESGGERCWPGGISNDGVDDFKLLAVRIRDTDGRVTSTLASTEPFHIEIDYDILHALPYGRVGIILSSSSGVDIMEVYDVDAGDYDGVSRLPGHYSSACTMPGHLFASGRYLISVNAGAVNIKNFIRLDNVLTFDIEETRDAGTVSGEHRQGCIRPSLNWHIAGRPK